jgi:Domain of unknown function DUF11
MAKPRVAAHRARGYLAVVLLLAAASPAFAQVNVEAGILTTGSTYIAMPFTFTNSGAAYDGVVQLTLTLDPAFSVVSPAPNGSGWVCNVDSTGLIVTCSTGVITLAEGAAAPALNLSLQVASTASLGTHSIAVTSVPSAVATNYLYTVIAAPQIGLQLAYAPPLLSSGDAATGTITATLSSLNQDTLTGTFTISATLPSGLTFNGNFVGTSGGWSCAFDTSQSLFCQSSPTATVTPTTSLQLPVTVVIGGIAPATYSVTATSAAQVNDGDGLTRSLAAAPAATSVAVGGSPVTVSATHQVAGSTTTGGPLPVGVAAQLLVQITASASSVYESLSFTDTLSPSLTITGTPTGTNWSCAVTGQQVLCSSVTQGAPGVAVSAGTVSIPVIAAATATGTTIQNTVSATLYLSSGGGVLGSVAGAATDSLPLYTPGQFSLSATHTPTGGSVGGSMPAGASGAISIVATNTSSSVFAGQLSVTDQIDPSISIGAVAATQGSWTCSVNAQLVTCTASLSGASQLPTGGSPGAISIPISIASGATAAALNNSAVLSFTPVNGAAATVSSAVDQIQIPAPAQLSIISSHIPNGGTVGSPVAAGSGGVITLVVKNTGSAAITAGVFTVTEQLSTFLTAGALASSQAPWTCAAATQVVTCTASVSAATPLAASASLAPISIPFGVPPADAAGPITTIAMVSLAPPAGSAVTATVNDVVQVLAAPPLSIALTHTPTGGALEGNMAPGGTGVLTMVAANTGSSALTGAFTVSGQLSSFLTLGSLASSQAPWTCTAAAQTVTCVTPATQSVAAATSLPAITIPFTVPSNATQGQITTTASLSVAATGISNLPVAATDQIQVAIPPQISIAASHTPSGGTLGSPVPAGSGGAITLTVANSGKSPIYGVFTVTDQLDPTLTLGALATSQAPWSCTAAGQLVTCTATLAATSPLAAGVSLASISIPFTASASAGGAKITNVPTANFSGLGATATATTSDLILISAAAALTLTATHTPNGGAVGGAVVPGSSGVITLTVSNSGSSALSGNFVVADTLDKNLTLGTPGSAGSFWNCGVSGQTVTCTVTASPGTGATLPSVSIPFSAVASPTVTQVLNMPTANFSGSGATATATTSDVILISAAAAMTLTATHTPNGEAVGGAVASGSSGVITLTVSNSGSNALSGSFVVADTLDKNLTLGTPGSTGSFWSCNVSGQTVTCTLTASPGAGAPLPAVSIPFSVVASPTVTQILNMPSATFTPAGGTALTASASDTIQISTAPSLSLTLTSSSAPVQSGGTATFTATVTNTGASAVSGTAMTLTSVIDPALAFSSTAPSGSGWTCTAPPGQTATCAASASFSLAAGATSSITIPVNVGAQASSSVTSLMTLNFGATAISQALTVQVTPLAVTLTAPTTGPSEGQPSITLASPGVSSAVTGCLALSFTPASSVSQAVDDPTIALALSNSFFTAAGSASRAATFTLTPGGAISQSATVSLGSTAGTVSLSAYGVAPGAACPPPSGATPLATQQISIATTPPVIQNVTLTSSGDTLAVAVTGFSNTRDLASAMFTFTAASGAAVQSGDSSLMANVSSLATPYFAGVSGGAFVYTQTFNLTVSAGDIASVAVSLANSAGQSTAPVSGSQ